MKKQTTFRVLTAIGVMLALTAAAPAALMSVSTTDPTVDGDDIAQLAGTTDAGGNAGHAWFNRPVHGQTFTTGTDPSGYFLSAVSLKARVDQNPGTTSPNWTIRAGSVTGTSFNLIGNELATGVAIPNTGGTTNPQWVTWTLGTPILLSPNTLYAFDVDPDGNGFIGLSSGNVYAGGAAFTSGSNGNPANPITLHNFDRAFHVDLAAAGPPIPEPLTMLAVGLGISGLGGYVRKRRRA